VHIKVSYINNDGFTATNTKCIILYVCTCDRINNINIITVLYFLYICGSLNAETVLIKSTSQILFV